MQQDMFPALLLLWAGAASAQLPWMTGMPGGIGNGAAVGRPDNLLDSYYAQMGISQNQVDNRGSSYGGDMEGDGSAPVQARQYSGNEVGGYHGQQMGAYGGGMGGYGEAMGSYSGSGAYGGGMGGGYGGMGNYAAGGSSYGGGNAYGNSIHKPGPVRPFFQGIFPGFYGGNPFANSPYLFIKDDGKPYSKPARG